MDKNYNTTPAIEQFEARLLMSASSTLAELAAAAQNVEIHTTGSVSVSSDLAANSSNVYKFTAAATGYLYLDMQANGSSLDSTLKVYNNSGYLYYQNDNATRNSKDSRVSMYVRAGDTYYAVAGGKDTAGLYDLSFTSNPYDDIANTLASARKLSLYRGSGLAYGQMNYSDDQDMFAVVADKSGRMIVNLNGTSWANFNTELFAYDAQGNLLGQDDDSGSSTNSQLTFDIVKGQTYYLAAASANGTVGWYTMNIQTQFVGEEIQVASTGTTSIGGLVGAEGKIYSS